MRLRSRGWHTVRQSAPTVWFRCPRDQPQPARARLAELAVGLRTASGFGGLGVEGTRRRARCRRDVIGGGSGVSSPAIPSPATSSLRLFGRSGAIRKETGLCCGSRLRKGEVFAYVGLPQNLKDLKVTSGCCAPDQRRYSRVNGNTFVSFARSPPISVLRVHVSVWASECECVGVCVILRECG